ncbi:MAG: hypothetical protein OXF00_01530, partial [bacterium]|nr:hypothetical protein [bacterium]
VQHTSRTRPIVRVLRFFYSCFKTLIVLPILFVFRNIFVIARNLYMILSKGYASWQPSRMKVWQKSVVVFLAEVIYWTAILAAISSVTTLILLNWVVLYEEISAVGNFFARAWNIILPIITILPILIILLAFGVAGLIITIIIVLVSDFVLGDIVSSLIGIGILLAAVVKLSVSGIE